MLLSERNIKDSLDFLEKVFKKAKVKVTPQRVEIFRIITCLDNHPTTDEIYHELVKKQPSASIDTVYRTLGLLTDLNLVKKVYHRKGAVRYDSNLLPHHHFFCVRCGSIQDFDNEKFSKLQVPKELTKFGTIQTLHVELSGLCKKCLKKESS